MRLRQVTKRGAKLPYYQCCQCVQIESRRSSANPSLAFGFLASVLRTYRHNRSREIDEGDNSQDLDRRSIFCALFLQQFSVDFSINLWDALSDLQSINT